jgi:hypothetical protein
LTNLIHLINLRHQIASPGESHARTFRHGCADRDIIVACVALQATSARGPGVCPRDLKLIGPVKVFGTEFEDSWWSLIYNREFAGDNGQQKIRIEGAGNPGK